MSSKDSTEPLLPPLPLVPSSEKTTKPNPHTVKTKMGQQLRSRDGPQQPPSNNNDHLEDTDNLESGLKNQLYDEEDYGQDGPPTDSATGEARSLRETELDNEFSALTLDDAREYDKRARRNLVDLESEMIALKETNRQQAKELKKLKTESLRFEKEIRRRLDREDAMDDRIYDDADDDSDGSNNEQTLRCVPDKRGEKMIQNYKWPNWLLWSLRDGGD